MGTPLVATSMATLVLCRVCLGLCEGVTFPVIHSFLAGHVPPSERSRAVGYVFFANQAGTIVVGAILWLCCLSL
jgi:predicted MFS family arabinose efflux permease